MKVLRTLVLIALAGCIALAGSGCGKKHKEGDGHDDDKAEGKGDGHGHGAEAPAGASFKPGKGVILTDETRKILGVEVADVVEQNIPQQVRFNVQVFGEKHHHALNPLDHTACDVHGSGFVSSNATATVKAGQPVQLFKGSETKMAGVVLTVQKALALGDAEIVIGVSNAAAVLKSGDFVPAIINLPRDGVSAVIPKSALLRTSEGTFVYAVNGDAFFRTAVKVGAEADGKVEITDGLLAGDQVVTKPLETLWLIELRATKGGGHSH